MRPPGIWELLLILLIILLVFGATRLPQAGEGHQELSQGLFRR